MKKNKKIYILDIIFMTLAVIFLFAFAFEFYHALKTIATYKASYAMTFNDEVHEYITRLLPFLAYSLMFYGFAEINRRLRDVHNSLDGKSEEKAPTKLSKKELKALQTSEDFENNAHETIIDSSMKEMKTTATKIEEANNTVENSKNKTIEKKAAPKKVASKTKKVAAK